MIVKKALWKWYGLYALLILLTVSFFTRPVLTQPPLQPIPVAPNRTSSGTMAAASATVQLFLEASASPTLTLSGTFVSTTTNIIFEQLRADDTWVQAYVIQDLPGTLTRIIGNICVTAGPCASEEEGNVTSGVFKFVNVAAAKAVRARMTARGGADSVTATFIAGYGQQDISIPAPYMGRADDTWGTTTSTCNDASINSCGAGSTLEIDTRNAASVIMWMRPDVTGNVTGGQITFDMSVNGGTTWAEASGSNGDYTQTTALLSGSTFLDGAEAGWRVPVAGADKMRIRLEAAVTCAGGAGSCTLTVSVRATSLTLTPFMIARQGEWDRFKATTSSLVGTSSTTVTGTNSTTGFDISHASSNVILKIADSGGTWVDGTSAISFEQSPDNTNWVPLVCADISLYTGQLTAFTLANGTWACFTTSGMSYVRVRGSVTLGADIAAINWWYGGAYPQWMYNVVMGAKALGAAATSLNPVLTGGYAVAVNSDPTTTGVDTAGDAVRATFNGHGVPYVAPGHPNTKSRVCHVADADNAQTGTSCVAASAGQFIVVTGVSASCSAANTVNVGVRVMFDTDGTFVSAATTGTDKELLRHFGIPPGGGQAEGYGGGIIGIGASDEDVRYSMDDPVSGGCDVQVSYYILGF